MRDVAQAADDLARRVHGVSEVGRGAGAVTAEMCCRRIQVEPQTGEERPEAVVQVPPESAALLLPGGDEAVPRVLEVTGEGLGPDQPTDELGDGREHQCVLLVDGPASMR